MPLQKTLNDIPVGETAVIDSLTTAGGMRRRLLDIGLIPGTEVKVLGKSPSGDPTAFLIRGAVIALREEDQKTILIRANRGDNSGIS